MTREKALAALDELPSIYQAIGTTAAAARRCKPTSKRGAELWAAYEKLNGQGAELMSTIRMFVLLGL
jgi:hypothetical protein